METQEIRRACRWRFIGVLSDKKQVELSGLPFISSDEEKIRKEARRRAIQHDLSGNGWIMDVIIEAVH